MTTVFQRFIDSKEEIAIKTAHPLDMVKELLSKKDI
jgi:hypothetical protein